MYQDIYWDNVGGETFEAAIEYSRLHARLVVSIAHALFSIHNNKYYTLRCAAPYLNTLSLQRRDTGSRQAGFIFLSSILKIISWLDQNTSMIFKKRLRIEGFLVPDLAPRLAPRFYAEMPALVAAGKITAKEHITEGLENGPAALADVLKEGGNEAAGKPIILVATE